MVQAGVPLNTVREILGHRDIKQTLRYAHLAPDHQREAMEVMDGLFRETPRRIRSDGSSPPAL